MPTIKNSHLKSQNGNLPKALQMLLHVCDVNGTFGTPLVPTGASPWPCDMLDSCTGDAIGPSRSHDSRFLCLCFAGERGDGGEAGGPVPPHCFQHSDAGLQEDPGESLSVGLEPQHVQHLLACADTTLARANRGRPCLCTDTNSQYLQLSRVYLPSAVQTCISARAHRGPLLLRGPRSAAASI